MPALRSRSRWPLVSSRRWITPLLAILLALPPLLFELAVRLGRFPEEALRRSPASTRLLDSRGQLLREVTCSRDHASCARAEWRPLDQISPLLREATIAVEDGRFLEHRGVDGIALLRAAGQDLLARRAVSGASTITMQLARLLRPHPRSLRGKLGEMIDARRLERALDKRGILEQYLNRAPYGAGTVGAEAASQRYFGKPAARLGLAEAALLAGLPKAPSDLNPLRYPAAARARQRHVLDRLLARGRIREADHRRALERPLPLASPRAGHAQPRAMHFTELVLASHPRRGELRTTLDLELQLSVEQAAREQVRSLAAAGASNAAVVVLENRRCAVRALSGSVDYWAAEGGAVNGATARRQPGSTLKPFTYALAFERGATPATAVADIETRYGAPEGRLFSPRNFGGGTSGPVLMGDALGRSLNLPAVRIARGLGVGDLLERLHRLGFASLDRPASHYGLGLTLGSGEVTLLELARAYAALARGGLACEAELLEESSPRPSRRVFSEEVAYLVTDQLSRESVRVTAFGPANSLMLGFPVAVKTGTSNDWRDSWVVGYTPEHTVAVWVGNFSGRPMGGVSGATGAGPLFHDVIKLAARGVVPRPFPPPRGIVEVAVCARSGMRPGPHCRQHRSLRLPADRLPSALCSWHREMSLDRRNGLRAGEGCPARHLRRRVVEELPPEYAAWQASRGLAPPTRFSPLCPATGAARVAIAFPRPGEVFILEPGYATRTQTLELRAEVEGAVAEIAWRIDGKPLARASWPYAASWVLRPGTHTVEVEADGRRSRPVAFEVR